MRTVLVVVAGVLGLLMVGGGITAVVMYQRAAAPDRSAPDVVVVNYLQSLLVARDQNRANLFTCGGRVVEIESFRDQISAKEDELDVSISINIENIVVVEANSSSATVEAVIRRTAQVDGTQQSLTDGWRFKLSDQDGWRVCTAQPY
ncbi:hypothetical protein [Micromonospora sp. DT233]|uniref:Rv0361 family membrane protein n=1 Tax=Micromonospora sp. DT233 TaxID=3393432 RepID=UPI003CF5E77D